MIYRLSTLKLAVIVSALLVAFLLTAMLAPQAAQAAPDNGYYGKVHYVYYGESLSVIARRYSVTVYELAKANGLHVNSHLYVHQKLYIPEAGKYYNGCAWYYKVYKGENLSSIAYYLGIDYYSLAKANHMYNPDHILAGTKLCIPQIYGKPYYGKGYDKGHGYKSGYDKGYDKGHNYKTGYGKGYDKGYDKGYGKGHYHVVKKGETLSKIAYYYGTDVYHLVKVNHLANKNHIYVGQHLKVGY